MVRTILRRRPRTRSRSKLRLRSRVKKVSRKRSRVKMTHKRKSRRSRRRIHRGGAEPGGKRGRNDEMEELYETYRRIYGESTATRGKLDQRRELISQLLQNCLSIPDGDHQLLFVIPHSLVLIGKKMGVPLEETDTPGGYIDKVMENLRKELLNDENYREIKRKLSQVDARHYPSIQEIKNPVEELPETYPILTGSYASGGDQPVGSARRLSLSQVQGRE